MIKKLLLLILLLKCSAGFAETIRTDVLVVGGGAGGVAAAIQSARSNVKTLLVTQSPSLSMGISGSGMYTLNANRNLASGIYAEFRDHIRAYYKPRLGYDTTRNAPLVFEPATGAAILKKISDTVKNLTVKLNTRFNTLKKDGTGWVVTVTIGGSPVTIKAKLVVDATEPGDVVAAAGSKVLDAAYTPYPPQQGGSQLYRTSIAVGDALPGKNINYCIALGAIVVKDQENLLVTAKPMGSADPAVQMTIGQGVGATAAYCIFFNTTTKNLKPRVIQGEILDHKGMLLPFADIKTNDRDYRAIQQVAATGLLEGIQRANGNSAQVLFMPDTLVRAAEIKPFLNEIYSRSFLWFNRENPGELFTVANLLSYISEMTLRDPANLQDGIRKTWKTYYHFPTDFNPNRPVTRREFAVLANRFLNPFARKVDISGRLVN
ncbi:MAG: FAD-dependent oxidoreductase [Bacteroidota bacterium]